MSLGNSKSQTPFSTFVHFTPNKVPREKKARRTRIQYGQDGFRRFHMSQWPQHSGPDARQQPQEHPPTHRKSYKLPDPQSDLSLTAVAGPFDVLNQLSSMPKVSYVFPYETQLRFNQYLLSFAELDDDASGILSPCVHGLGNHLAADTLLLYAFVSLTAALVGSLRHGPEMTRLAEVTPLSPGVPVEFCDSLALKTRASRLVRDRIANEARRISYYSIAAISMLAMSEAVSLGNEEISRLHCSAVFQSIKLQGGIESVPYFVRYSAWSADFKTSALSLSAPHFDVPAGMPPIEDLQALLSDYPHYTSTSNLPAHAIAILSPETVLLIKQLRGLEVYGAILGSKDITDPRVTADLLPMHYHQIEHRLLSLIATFSSSGSIDRTVILTALIYFYTVTWLRYPAKTMLALVLAGHLKAFLETSSVTSLLKSYPDLRAWILVMGAVVVQGLRMETWFSKELSYTIVQLGITTPEALRNLLRKFLYVENKYALLTEGIFHNSLSYVPKATKIGGSQPRLLKPVSEFKGNLATTW